MKQPVLQEQGDYREGIRSAGARGEIAQVKLSGWWLSHPSEKYESVGMMTFPIYEKVKNVPNHQPAINNGMFYHLSTGAGFRVAIHRTND